MVVSNEEPVMDMTVPGSHGVALTNSALDTFAVKNRGRNGDTSMETQHMHTGWP